MAAKTTKSLTDNYKKEKATKNMVRFQVEKGDPKEAPMGYIYINNDAMKKLGNPTKIKVTVEAI
jgi:hypothetical protein